MQLNSYSILLVIRMLHAGCTHIGNLPSAIWVHVAQWLERPTGHYVDCLLPPGYNSSYIPYNTLFLSDEGPTLETLDYTIRIGSTPTFL